MKAIAIINPPRDIFFQLKIAGLVSFRWPEPNGMNGIDGISNNPRFEGFNKTTSWFEKAVLDVTEAGEEKLRAAKIEYVKMQL